MCEQDGAAAAQGEGDSGSNESAPIWTDQLAYVLEAAPLMCFPCRRVLSWDINRLQHMIERALVCSQVPTTSSQTDRQAAGRSVGTEIHFCLPGAVFSWTELHLPHF